MSILLKSTKEENEIKFNSVLFIIIYIHRYTPFLGKGRQSVYGPRVSKTTDDVVLFRAVQTMPE